MVIEIARRISAIAGLGESCARWGGDEFIVLLGDSAPHLLRAMAYQLMAEICDKPVALPEGRSVSVTISVGACMVEPGDSIETATDMADAALYIAKGEGRNKVVIFEPGIAAQDRFPAAHSQV